MYFYTREYLTFYDICKYPLNICIPSKLTKALSNINLKK